MRGWKWGGKGGVEKVAELVAVLVVMRVMSVRITMLKL